MTDCQHWIPVMLEQDEEERRRHVAEMLNVHNLVHEMRALINCLDGATAEYKMSDQERLHRFVQQYRASVNCNSLQQQALAARQSDDYASRMPSGGLLDAIGSGFGGLFR